MLTKPRTIVSAIILSTDQKILMGKVYKGGVYPDCWHIPGGGVEPGETKDQALVREIQEEVGLDIQKYQLTLVSNTGTGESIKTDKHTGEKILYQMQFNVYEVQLDTKAEETSISLNDDLEEYQWVAKDQLSHYKLTPPSIELFTNLGWL